MDCILQNELNFLLPFFNSLNAAEVSDCSYLLVWIHVNEKKKKNLKKNRRFKIIEVWFTVKLGQIADWSRFFVRGYEGGASEGRLGGYSQYGEYNNWRKLSAKRS